MMEIEGLSARCAKHPLDTISVAGSYYRRNLEAHRYRHNRELHPRGHYRENARRKQILEQITPMFKELGKPASPPPRPYVRKPGEGFEDSDQI